MGSLGGEASSATNKAMLVYPKMFGANPSERWGHSACFFNGLVYIFGGCRGGVHFSDVLVCNLSTMAWNILKTSGQGPGPLDSHGAVLVGHKMLVFGGTNGSKKVNGLHILDLLSREWSQPLCIGNPPSPRESHTINVIGEDKLVVFGGSGEGESNYLNDLHFLDLKNMEWSSPNVRGNLLPAPRDSHSSVAVGNRLFVFGGDSGDRFQGDVCMLDVNKMIWSKVDARGPWPGARAGHAAVSIGTKIYVLGGVGDKQYYNDLWVLDAITLSWIQLDICSQKSQGRFSHTATITNLGIAIFGGCGEDEHPLNELLILQIDSPTCSRAFGNTYKEEIKMFSRNAENNNSKSTVFVCDNEDLSSSQEVEELPKQSFHFSSDMLHPKRRRTSNNNSALTEQKLELEKHSVSKSQQSSPSQSDHDQIPAKKSISNYPSSRTHPLFRQKNYGPSYYPRNSIPGTCPDIYFKSPDHRNPINQENRNIICTDGAESLSLEAGKFRNMIGAEVRGHVDVAFDSGYLMTATVNGKVFRGVLFSPGPDLVSRGAFLGQHPLPPAHHNGFNHENSGVNNNASVAYPRLTNQPVKKARFSPENGTTLRLEKDSRAINNTELQGVVLTLASPGSDHVRL
ncbi:hypothetical protein ACP275_14G081900 [Erythranthe tilingii]